MLSATTPAERADQMIAMAGRLVHMIRAEAEAMEQRNLNGAEADRAEKDRLIHAWRLEVDRIRRDPTLIAGIDPSRKTALKTAAQTIEAEIQAHAVALAAMKTVTEGLVRRIGEEIAVARRGPQGYAQSGAIAAPDPRAAIGATLDAKA